MFKVIKDSIKIFDYFIMIAAVIMFAGFDYDNLNMIDKIYIVTFIIWFVLLAVRIYIIYQGGRKK